MNDWTELHDSVLVSVHLEWDVGILTMTLRTAAGQKLLQMVGVTVLDCPRRLPWGPSVCINEVRDIASTVSEQRVTEIEMQSGDVITIARDGSVVPKLVTVQT